MPPSQHAFTKQERVCSKKVVDRLFNDRKSKSMAAYPVRAVFLDIQVEEEVPPLQILISVPKRYHKRAVARNRVKRQVREAYRRNKAILAEALRARQRHMVVAFIWIADELCTRSRVERRVKDLLVRISESL